MKKTIEGYELPISALAAVLVCAAQDDVRYYLNGVYLDFPKGRIVATDGHRLFCGAIPAADVEPVIVARGQAEQALKAHGKLRKRERESIVAFALAVTEAGGVRSVAIHATAAGAVFTDKAIDGRFPDYERVIPLNPSGDLAQYDPLYIASAAEALGRFDGRDRHKLYINIEHNGNAAGLVTMEGVEAFCIVMPVRAGPASREWYRSRRRRGPKRRQRRLQRE